MAPVVQGPWLGVVALGDNTKADPDKGNHLRWAFASRLGFPPRGFDVYRRPHFTAPPVCVTLQGFTSNQDLGRRVALGNVLLESEKAIRTVELVAAGGAPEIDLRNKPPLTIRPREVCHRVRVFVVDLSGAGGTIRAVAFDGHVPVSADRTVMSSAVQFLDLSADRIDRVVISAPAGAMNGVLTQICYTTVAADAEVGWIRLNATSICLPLSDHRYPAACRFAAAGQEWPTAARRIPETVGAAPVRARYAGQDFADLRDTLSRIYDPSDAPLSTSDRSCPPAAGDEQTPKFVHDPLGVVTLATLDPYIARMLGLYWIDGAFYVDQGLQGPAAAVAGTSYDYRVTAHYGDPPESEGIADGWDADNVAASINGSVPHGPLTYSTTEALSVVAREIEAFGTVRALSIPNNEGRALRIGLLESAQLVELSVDVPDANGRAIAKAFTNGVEVAATVRPAAVNGPTVLQLAAEAIDAVELEGRNFYLARVTYYTDYLPGGDISAIVYDVTLGNPPALAAPSHLHGDPLPVITALDRECDPVTGQMAAGLRWGRDVADGGILPGGAVLYDLQRQALGSGAEPDVVAPDAWDNVKTNIVVAPLSFQSACEPYEPLPGWPAERALFIDVPPAPQDRWFAYRARGKDIFGRTSGYRQSDPVDLADIIPPPPPADVHAKYLDPDDPFLNPDERAWTHPANSEARHGLRIGWRWTDNLLAQAPDIAQFRTYLQIGRLNVVLGNIMSVEQPDADGHVRLTTDVSAADLPAGDVANAFQSEWLSQAVNLYEVVASGSTAGMLTLTVALETWQPPAEEGREIVAPALQPIPTRGTFSVSVRAPKPLAGTVTAAGAVEFTDRVIVDTDVRYTGANNSLAGKKLRQSGRLWSITGNGTGWRFTIDLRMRACDLDVPVQGQQFTVVGADGVTAHLVDPGNPHWRDYRDPANWTQRLHVEPSAPLPSGRITLVTDHGDGTSTLKTDYAGEVPDRYLGGDVESGQYAWTVVGLARGETLALIVRNTRMDRVSGTVDLEGPSIHSKLTYRPDLVLSIAPLAIRAGHGAAYAAVAVSAADDKTYATDRWPGGDQAGNEGLVSPPAIIIRPDRSIPPACTANVDVLMAKPADFFGRSSFIVRWNTRDDATLRYHVFRTLAEPDGSEPLPERWGDQYRLLTAIALSPDDPACRDVAEPGHAAALPELMAYQDTLDGKSTSPYYYRVRTINAAGTRGDWSDPIGPVECPDIVPPRAPRITKILGGDRRITLRWASNREPDLAEYRVYRAESREASRDLRLMTLVHTTEEARVSAERPAEVDWTDEPLPGLTTFYYRLVAVDDSSNASRPTVSVTGRTFDESLPAAAEWRQVDWVKLDEFDSVHDWQEELLSYTAAIRLQWTPANAGHTYLVQRKEIGGSFWESLSNWSESSDYRLDKAALPSSSYWYRVQTKNRCGRVATSALYAIEAVVPPT